MKITVDGTSAKILQPNICPHCHVRNQPRYQMFFITKDERNQPEVITVWVCGNNECNRFIVASHGKVGQELPIKRFLNGYPKGPEWPQPITTLKSGQDSTIPSKFIKTYLQSLKAESEGLDEIAGMGYRKAIEYLVKDWATQLNPEEKDKIHSSWLGKVITGYFDGDLKEILERATWLGNDQSHYIKLFEEYDLGILKDLISLILVELDRQHKKKHYIDTITSRKF